MNKLLLFTWLLLSGLVWGQTKLDSLRNAWQDVSQPDTTRLKAAISLLDGEADTASARRIGAEALALAQRQVDPGWKIKVLVAQAWSLQQTYRNAEAQALFAQVIELAPTIPDSASWARALTGLGFGLEDRGRLTTAREQFEQSFRLHRAQRDTFRMAGSAVNMGRTHAKQGNYLEATQAYLQGLQMARQAKKQSVEEAALSNLGILHSIQGDYQQAAHYFEEGLALARRLRDSAGIGSGLINLGIASQEQGQPEQALAYFEEGVAVCRASGDLYYLSNGLSGIGFAYIEQQQPERARPYYEESLAIKTRIGDLAGVAYAQNGLATIAVEAGQYRSAIELAQQALTVNQDIGFTEQISRSSYVLYRSHKALNQLPQALAMHELYFAMTDSLQSDEAQRAVLRQEYQFEYQQQALQDSLTFVQQQTRTELAYQSQLNQRNLLLLGATIVLLLGALGFLYFRYRQQQRSRARELELARERERKEQLTELDRLKSQFFANLSHEFRTPLTLILGQNQSLQADIDDPRLDAKFDMVDRNGRRLLELVNQVLDLSKLESGRMELALQTFDLLPFLKNLLFSFESLADQKRQQLIFQSQEDSLLMVADPAKLERVFFNLLSNAVKFTPEGGSITVKLQMMAHRVHVGVLDTGVGISAEQQGQVFDRFYQAQGGANQPAPGTGIGLALAKELVELHRGQIELRSQVGQGSEFWVNLPLSAGVAAELTPPYEPQLEPLPASVAWPVARQSSLTNAEIHISNSQSRILIVEDNPDVRSYLRQELLGLGYQVLEAADGQAGLAQAQAEQPDLIISDVMMPKMDGFELARAIRADARSSHIPLILLTAKASQESRITGLETGVDAYLTKPFNARELRVRIANLIEQRQLLRQKFAKALTIKPEEVSAVPMDQQFLQTVTATIEAHLGDAQFGVEPLAKAVGMSVTHLNRKLKALVGQSAGKLIRSMRLQRAADLLQQQAGTVSEIAYDLGFGDPTNFGRAFKAQFGVTPGQWGEGIGDW